MPSADPRNYLSTGEPGAVKAARPVRRGADGKVPTDKVGNSPAAYPTLPIRVRCAAVWCRESQAMALDGQSSQYREATQGTCTVCGTKITVMGGAKAAQQ